MSAWSAFGGGIPFSGGLVALRASTWRLNARLTRPLGPRHRPLSSLTSGLTYPACGAGLAAWPSGQYVARVRPSSYSHLRLGPMAAMASTAGPETPSSGGPQPNQPPSTPSHWVLMAGVALVGVGLLTAKLSGQDLVYIPSMLKKAAEGADPPESSAPNRRSSNPVESVTSVATSTPDVPQNLPVTSLHRAEIPDLPRFVPYVLVGAGAAAFAAFRAIKSEDPTAKVLMIGDENHYPYMRPPLSKELWYSDKIERDDISFTQWNGRQRSLYFEPPPFFTPLSELTEKKNGGVSIVRGHKVVKVNSVKQEVELDNGSVVGFKKCLIATGGRPKKFPVLDKNPLMRAKVSTFRTAQDFFDLKDKAQHMKKIAIIGGGFLGSELACALALKSRNKWDSKLEVIQIFPENGKMGKVLPEYLSAWTTEKVRDEGVTIKSGQKIEQAEVGGPKNDLILTLSDGEKLTVDHAVVAIGLEANTDLAKSSRLEVDNEFGGFRVNAELEARSNVYVAGDAASFYDVILGRRRVEHHDHAIVSGRQAGLNMVRGLAQPYTHQSMFWSDLGPDVGYEAVGLIDSTLPTVGVFARGTQGDTPKAAVTQSDEAMRSESQEGDESEASSGSSPVSPRASSSLPLAENEKYGKGVIFYLKDDVVVGVLMWNVFNRVSLARRIIRENKRYEDLADLAKLFDIYKDEEEIN
ncbi:hypothetical protein TCAL_05593 [Tigriopus californicus]|uniref:FAD/NAD(P)-binding domain-containing protein n=1 Tax=Tigriopus californicus TaxID=6832 RepID=A0A553NEP2_TIGCA|nr:apoptosis-inducing factor 1, mitochondrial-like [Tigriopus californicus]TRY63913.1 hypothetical protein TCAL_05593 [Tigriopus californicus]